MQTPRHSIRIACVWVVLLMGCGPSTPPPAAPRSVVAEPTAAEPAPPAETPPEVSPPAPAPVVDVAPEEGPGTPFAIACGRARTEAPSGWTVEGGDCVSEGGGLTQPLETAENLSYGVSRHRLVAADCALSLETRERPDVDGAGARDEGGAFVSVATPDDSTIFLRVGARRPSERCLARVEPVLSFLRDHLEVPPLEPRTARAALAFGHVLRVELPAGFTLSSTGGLTDQWQVSYALRGPGEAFVSIYSWYTRAEGPFDPRRFRARVLPRRPRWVESPDPWQDFIADLDSEADGPPPLPCRSVRAVGPEPRAAVAIHVCGPEEEHAPLIAILREMRFERAPDL